MKRYFALAMMLMALLIASCGPGIPDFNGTDWCYKFDFTKDDNGFSVPAGSWQDGTGLVTDGGGLLQFAFGYDSFVEPLYVIILARRGGLTSGPLDISASGNVFGISATFSATLPAEFSSYPAVFQSSEVGLQGNSVNVSVQASDTLVIPYLEVRGMGSSPFPVNTCDDTGVDLTPSTDTPTPEFTYTPTITATSTITRTPTITPTPSETFTPSPTTEPWTCTWDFTVSAENWDAWIDGTSLPRALYSGGVGFVRGGTSSPDQQSAVQLVYDFGTTRTITSATIYASDVAIAGFQFRMPDVGGSEFTSSYFDTGSDTGTVSVSTSSTGVWLSIDNGSGVDYLGAITSVVLSGTGGPPTVSGTGVVCTGATPTPTPTNTGTPVGTLTPTASTTPPGGWTCTFNFVNAAGGWASVFNAQWSLDDFDNGAWRAKTVTPANSLGIRYTAAGNMPLTSIRIKGRTYGTRTDDPDELNFRTYDAAWGTYTQDSFDATAFDRTYNYSGIHNANRVEVYLGVSQTTVTATYLELVEFKGIGGTNPCLDSGTPTATMIVTLTPVGTGTGTLTPLPLRTGTPRPATRTPIPINTFVVLTPLSVTPGTPGTPGGTGTPAETGTPASIPGVGSGILQGAGQGVNTGWGALSLFFDWAGQISANVSGVINAFFTTPPQAIPGLPQCMTRPLESDICAIYYIMHWTIFAPGTPGALIIPLCTIILDFYVFVHFVRWVIRLIRRGESITSV